MGENKKIARRIMEELFAEGRFELLDELVSPRWVGHDVAMPEPSRGRDSLKQLASGYRSAFPDLEVEIDRQLEEGDLVCTSWKAQGTHHGELFGIAPTSKQVTVTGVTIDRITSGRVVESWMTWDVLGLMQQLGAVKAPALAGAL